MLHPDVAVHVDPVAAVTSVPRLDGPLTYASNRAVMTARRKTPGTVRLAVVGDSMAYGAGIEYRKGLAARLAFHLNGALPESWVEGLTFGVPGGCLYDATGRTITHALPTSPDVAILCLCSNDAFLLAPRSPQLEAVGRQWVTFKPLIRRTLESFRDAVSRNGTHAMVVYLDRFVNGGDVCMPEEIASACAAVGLPFFDGSKALAGFSMSDVTVSSVDSHLNEFANDIVARQVAQMILGFNWFPAGSGFSGPAWMHVIEREARARVRAGLPGVLAFPEALTVLERKWSHRRNTNRRRFETEY